MSLISLLEKAATGGRLTFEEGVRIYKEADLHDLGAAAHARRMQLYPTNVAPFSGLRNTKKATRCRTIRFSIA